jgi:hypothetical protein
MRERLRFIGLGTCCIAGLGLGSWHIEQFTRPHDVLGTLAAGEQAAVSDAVEAGWQNVDEEAADELAGVEHHDLVPRRAFGAIVLVLEGHAGTIECDQPTVGDGDAMGIPPNIFEDLCRSGEGPFRILLVAGFSGVRIRPKAAEMWGSALDGGLQSSDGAR